MLGLADGSAPMNELPPGELVTLELSEGEEFDGEPIGTANVEEDVRGMVPGLRVALRAFSA